MSSTNKDSSMYLSNLFSFVVLLHWLKPPSSIEYVFRPDVLALFGVWGKVFSFLLLNMVLLFIRLSKFPFICRLLRISTRNRSWISSNAFSKCNDIVFLFYSQHGITFIFKCFLWGINFIGINHFLILLFKCL